MEFQKSLSRAKKRKRMEGMPVAIRRPERRLGRDSWRKMTVDGAMDDRRCRGDRRGTDCGGSTLGLGTWVREMGRLRGPREWDVDSYKDALD